MSDHDDEMRERVPGPCQVGRQFRLDDLPAGLILNLHGLDWVAPCPAQTGFTFCNLVPGRHIDLCTEHAMPVITMLQRQD